MNDDQMTLFPVKFETKKPEGKVKPESKEKPFSVQAVTICSELNTILITDGYINIDKKLASKRNYSIQKFKLTDLPENEGTEKLMKLLNAEKWNFKACKNPFVILIRPK